MHIQGSHNRRGDQLTSALGWVSIGLGATKLVAPGSFARAIGARDSNTSTIRAVGALELGGGLAILAAHRRSARGSAAHSGTGSVRVEHVETVNRPVDEVYRSWKNFEAFPSFMQHLESVEVMGGGRSRWTARGPAGSTVEWEAQTVEDREGELIAWRSLEGSQVQNSGTVRFRPAPGARGTEVRVTIEYSPPAGRLGRGIAWLFGEEPEQQIREDLRRFKQLMETGEISVSDGTGLWRPARPAKSLEEVKGIAGVQS